MMEKIQLCKKSTSGVNGWYAQQTSYYIGMVANAWEASIIANILWSIAE